MEDSGQIGAGSLMPAPSLAGHPSSESSAPVQAVCDPNLVKQYILDLIPVLLGRSDEEDAITALFAFPDAGEKCRQFANDGQVPVLYINKENEASGKEADSDEDEAMAFSFSTVTYSLSFELTWSPTHVGSIAMIKRTPVLDPILPLSTQIQIMNLPGPASVASAPSRANDSESATAVGTVALASANPYEALHAYIHHAMSPYFNAFISAKEKADAAAAATVSVAPGVSVEGPSGMARRGDDKDAQSGIPLAKKKIAELELSLLHLQQNVDIPEVRLNIHPVVIHAVEGARQDGHKRVTVDAVSPDLLADSTFLNHLQSDVNGWIKEIQKVTKLDRDPSSGTASQEINFWQSMERALNHIEEQLNGDEVVLTMQILKAAKRFHATVSFRTDTGLKEAAERVTRYNVLMKDFPLNELLSATDIPKIRDALDLIFGHLNKKLRISPYPVRRVLPLVEAISRDLQDQVAKVLGQRRLMYMPYHEFERLAHECAEAFQTWEEHIKDFTNVAREVTRKRMEKFIPIKVRFYHTPLQERLYFVAQFRSQHEQLQQTITRVMGGSGILPLSEAGSGDGNGGTTAALDAVEEIHFAYDSVKGADVLDLSPEGTEAWERAETTYNERVARVENQIISQLRDHLAMSKNASEMFRVFSKFNSLFVRPKIRGAIKEYQTQLIESVKEDIRRLHDKFKLHYRQSESYIMSQLRGIPPVSGAIIWTRQIERQLDMYMQRVEAVLGKGWEMYAEGQRLYTDSASFRRKLDTRLLYDAWYSEISRRDLSVSGRVFMVTRSRASSDSPYQLGVNFDAQLITLFREVRQLLWLGFPVPHTLVNVARDGRRVYPFAVSLIETVRTYRTIMRQLKENPSVVSLVAGYLSEAQALIRRGFHLKWDNFVNAFDYASSAGAAGTGPTSAALAFSDMAASASSYQITFVNEFASVTTLLQEKVANLIAINADINLAVAELGQCSYMAESIREILERIQGLVDRLNLENYANLERWVLDLDARIERVLMARLRDAIGLWVHEFSADRDASSSLAKGAQASGVEEAAGRRLATKRLLHSHKQRHAGEGATSSDTADGEDKPAAVRPKFHVLVHELCIRNQQMYLDPPIEHARSSWYSQLHAWMSVVCQQRRPQASRYELVNGDTPAAAAGPDGLADSDSDDYFHAKAERFFTAAPVGSTPGTAGYDKTYKHLYAALQGDTLSHAYSAIEERIAEASEYVKVWLQYQALWDLDTEQVLSFLGDDLLRWREMLFEIKRARSTFDNSEVEKRIGAHLVIDYEQVQSKVNAKYDSWQRDILNRFGGKLSEAMRARYEEIAGARHELEQHYSVETSDTGDAVSFITFVQDLKRKHAEWKHDVEEVFRGGQWVLERQRYQFPADWLHLGQVEGEWSAFNEILARKDNVIQEQLAGLQLKIVAEDRHLIERISALCAEWEESKPVQGNLRPDVATNTLNVYEGKVTRLIDEYKKICRAKEALDLETGKDEGEDRLQPVLEEVRDLKSVWAAMGGIWSNIDVLRESLWASIVPRKVRQQLDRLIGDSKKLPSRMRQYAAFEYMQQSLRKLLKANLVIADLKSDALRDRHWRKLFKLFKLEGRLSMSDLTLGHIWDFDLVANEKTVRDVIIVAQGEMGLEEFLKQVKETWTSYVLELVPYQNKCRLIKGWDELFAKCSEQLNALTAMKASPYYKVFEEEAAAWEERLTRVHVLFDVWIDVQRQWVYLEGIFTGSADIKHLLPVESSRFQNINTEFLAVMKRVYKSPYTLDVLNLPNIQRSLERLADLLSKIQKALGEYLERERSSFPRFYFVGDEDLLEIIGNAKDVSRIQKHLKKMFAGIALIHMNEDEKEILGMISKEGERVDFRRPVSLRNSPKINEWLGMLESEMRLTLAHLLASAVDDLEGIVASGANINADVFLSWVERYPSQLVVLAMQINWTRVTEAALSQDSEGSASALSPVLALVERGLDVLAHAVLRSELQPLTRKKCEHLITELVHQRDVVRSLADTKAKSSSDFVWLYHMRFYFSSAPTDNPLERLDIRMADGSFLYGYEYLGVPDRLVQTPLTDKCYLTLTQALQVKLGGSPFGPAGTGKCWAKGTMILMADGSEKPVEDIAEGDVVMGDDCHGRTVGAVTAGTGPMYQIVPCSRYAEEFECNGAHILVLRWAADALMTSMVADRGCSVQATWFEYCSAENMIYRRSAMFDSEAAAQLFVRSGQAASLVGPGFIWEVPLTTYLRADRSVQERCVMYRADAVVRRGSEGIVRKFIAEQPEVAPEAADELVKSVAWTLGYYLAMSNIDENDGPDRLTGISQMAKVESLVGPLVRHIQGSKTGELNRRHVLQALMLDELECVRYPLIAGIIDAQQQQQPAGDALLLAKERSAVTVADYDRDFLVQVRRIAAGSGLLVSKPQLEANNYYSIRLGGATLSKLPVISAGARVKLAGFSHQPQPQQQPQQYQWSFKVKPLGMGEYYGFTIASGSNRRVLLSRDLAVSHNTESVKALGTQLGRFVLVFCCDENFDFQAMGRIFVGLCQVGAWGCFDEFNRLEERILSAVSQQIQTIQLGLRKSLESSAKSVEIELVGKSVRLHNDTGIFITMNPGYAGRSNLPDNLKKLFRSFAMTKPDRELIAQVMLYSQGFRTAELLASKVVPLFNLCMEQLSPQPHYDFGLRALKSVLVSAGNLKRGRLLNEAGDDPYQPGGSICDEQELLIQSIRETVMPKLVGSDIPLLDSLLTDVFPGVNYMPVNLERLCAAINEICERHNWIPGQMWMDKVVQLYQIQNIHHGLMMVGPSGTGKTSAWQTLLAAMEKLDGIEGVPYVIDPKAVSKDDLYGTLDPTTREWTDGLFTHILRKIVDNVRGESAKRHWIVFDGDVDPEWVENLNSVLDDNRLLTLPNGERLALPSNVRIMFEVETLKYATLATVSRCGMVWFSDDIVSFDMVCRNYLETLKTVPLDADDDGDLGATVVASARRPEDGAPAEGEEEEEAGSPILRIQREAALVLAPHFEPGNLVERCLDYATSLAHIMDFTRMRALSTLFSLLNQAVCSILEYNAEHPDFPLGPEATEQFLARQLVLSIIWSFTGDSPLAVRSQMSDFIRNITAIELPPFGVGGEDNTSILDYYVSISSGSVEWAPWTGRVPSIDIETHKVADADIVIPTVDTVRHEEVLYSWLSEHKPVMLCGPPGSGKTMTLFSALRKLPSLEVVGLNFSSATTPELILKTFEQHCEYRKTPNGVTLSPVMLGRWLVVFCDEINLPSTDKYGTQRVISFIRQLIERGGYWRASDQQWVRLDRVQFVGACNPPTDPGRVPLSHRFLRHAPLVMVDYPGQLSLNQIYGTFNRALLKVQPTLRAYAEPLTAAMVDVYLASQSRFTPDQQAHYVYSPRELTRWMRGIYEAIAPLESLTVEGLVRVWAHEALRLFQDRLVSASERQWTEGKIDSVARFHFPTIDHDAALRRPILYSNWLSRHYIPVDREELRDYVSARLKVFYEEELDVPLVLFNDVLEHVLRIDRVFRQPQGHALLIGVSGSGKTTLTRFVAWMNGLSVFQLKAHNRYTAADFDEDLRSVLRRAGCRGERICFILDESNVLDSGFLERMNTLLANAEVPGLFEGDEYAALITACREGAAKEGSMIDSQEELYAWFTRQVARNLHVVFTMNPPPEDEGLASRAATSPALFNRCVLDWFGDWSDQALYQVGREFTALLDLDDPDYLAPDSIPIVHSEIPLPPSHRDAIINSFVYVHKSLAVVNARLAQRQGRINYVTPRHYLDFIQHYVRLYRERQEDLEEQQRHLNVGLDKLYATVNQVKELRESLAAKKTELETKTNQANEKLRQMVQEQQEAEQKRTASIQIQAELEEKNRRIEERRVVVMEDLQKAEPAVIEAQRSVSNIKKQQLTEVRSMANPPAAVKMAMESVCVLLGHRQTDWKTLQSIIRRDDFIPSIVNFDTDRQMTRALREKLKREYLGRPEYNFETVNRASKACGPLVKWALAQVNFAEILERVGPLRNEVKQLESDAEETRVKAATMEKMIEELEASIARYKEEYAALISEIQQLKAEMQKVESKVDRSVKLLGSLSSEQERWEKGSATFKEQMATIAGDALLSSAFLAYSGYFDQQYREQLFSRWCTHLERSGIKYYADLRLSEYLSTTQERLEWSSQGLPPDDLAVENAVMLGRFNRYPLIIDPSGQATQFLKNNLQAKSSRDGTSRKLTVTSFLDDAFLKHLESALRFGNAILIQDVEHLDPILNPILNRELRRTGGRVLIRLGNQDIDFSPAFTLYLSTRDPSVTFPPDVSSRVTFVNFTVTRASLQSQCLNQVLQSERPDIEERRRDLIKLQGEFRLRLHALEKELLRALNASQGNILDDDTVIATLETLKTEAAEIARKVEETDGVMQEVNDVTITYTPLAHACSAVYFALEHLGAIHHFYQFSLDFFKNIFDEVVERNPNLKGVTDQARRIGILKRDLLSLCFRRASVSLLHHDHLVLLMQLVIIKLRSDESDGDGAGGDAESDLEFILSSSGGHSVARPTGSAAGGDEAPHLIAGYSLPAVELPSEVDGFIDDDCRSKLGHYAQELAWFRNIGLRASSDVPAWCRFLRTAEPELAVPASAICDSEHTEDGKGHAPKLSAVGRALREWIIIRLFRPDRVVHATTRLVATVFSSARTTGYGNADNAAVVPSFESLGLVSELNLAALVKDEVSSRTPIALCSVPGHDASYRVESLAAETRARIQSVAMGSVEGFTLADQAIASAAKSGTWVLLKNVHLATNWLSQLEKRLVTLSPHPQFRLFLTMEINPKVPVNLLRHSRVLVFEPPPGIKANLIESLGSISPSRANRGMPAERARLYFLLAWLHAIVIERLRYSPLGWTKVYEFNDSDFACALSIVDGWLESAAKGKSNLDPAAIPWDAIRTLLNESVYGGRIDNDFDRSVLKSFVNYIFSPAAYNIDFPLVDGLATDNSDDTGGETREGSKLVTLDGKLVVPEGTLFQQFLEWCHKLPDREPPTWLGLPSNAENLLLTQRGNMLVQKILQLKALNDDVDEIAYDPTATAEFDQRSDEPKAAGAEKAELPTYMRQIHVMCTTWLNMLPTELPELHGLSGLPSASAANTNDPISRVFEREYTITRSLLATVRDDLAQVQRVCRNEQKQTNHLRSLLTHLNAGKIPPSWLETYTVPKDFTIAKWVMDFADRLDQIQRVTNQVTPGVSAKDVIRREGIWLGGLVFPEAFITATRQEAAKSLGTSLEELELAVKFAPLNGDGAGGNEFSLCRLRLEGARLRPGSEGEIIPLSEGGGEKLDAITLYWDRMPGSNAINGSLITLPVYLNSDRKDLLFSARVPVFAADAATPTSLVCKEATQRAIAIVAA